MIYSTGIDIVEIERIDKVYRRYGDRFLHKIFSDDEIASLTSKKKNMTASLAGKFAAKEAVMKSLGVFFEDGVYLKDIEILNQSSGQPYIRLADRLTERLRDKKILISISHEKRFAVANSIISDKTPRAGQ